MEEELIRQAAPFWSYLPAIITAIGTIVMGWFGYNQHTKDKLIDQKIEQWKNEETQKASKRSEDLAKIYGELWNVLRATNADRVYIIQPHPLINNEYISISMEVKDNGISSMKPVINKLSMEELPKFCSELASVDFIYYKDTQKDVKDEHMRSIFHANGSDTIAIKRITTPQYGWIGSLVIDYCRKTNQLPEMYQYITEAAIDTIRYILPEFK